jgi:hypothetical protein
VPSKNRSMPAGVNITSSRAARRALNLLALAIQDGNGPHPLWHQRPSFWFSRIGLLGSPSYSPVAPSMACRSRSAWPLWRAYSRST